MSDINHSRMIPLHIADQAVAACEKEIAALKAEVARLRASSFVTAVPVEQYERVVKAGDALADALNLDDDVFDNHEKKEAQAAWNAAKEGKPSV
jgi:hypothetical protein